MTSITRVCNDAITQSIIHKQAHIAMYVYTSSFYLCHRKDLELHLSSSQFFPPDINERIETKSEKIFIVSHIQQQHVDEIFFHFLSLHNYKIHKLTSMNL